MESRVVCLAGGHELIRADTQSVDLDRALVADAREQLMARDRQSTPGFRWGYLLGVEDADAAAGPAVAALKAALYEQVVAPVAHCRAVRFDFSFFKAATGQPPVAEEGVHYSGLHLDTHPDIAADEGVELLRVLVNLGSSPRCIRFLPIDRFELAGRGVRVRRADYQVVAEPPDLPSETVEIPAFDRGSISYLTFWASVVPHVGVDTPAGYFLGSFEALAPFEPVRAEAHREDVT